MSFPLGESHGVDHVAGNVNPVAVTATVVTDTEMCYYGADELQRPEDLERIASDKGFLISENQGLGNCMFYALVEQLQIVKGIEISHEELRVNLVQFLKENYNLKKTHHKPGTEEGKTFSLFITIEL
ncbi:uncharacterized protein LOC144634716 [Oculina patagonica]